MYDNSIQMHYIYYTIYIIIYEGKEKQGASAWHKR